MLACQVGVHMALWVVFALALWIMVQYMDFGQRSLRPTVPAKFPLCFDLYLAAGMGAKA